MRWPVRDAHMCGGVEGLGPGSLKTQLESWPEGGVGRQGSRVRVHRALASPPQTGVPQSRLDSQ